VGYAAEPNVRPRRSLLCLHSLDVLSDDPSVPFSFLIYDFHAVPLLFTIALRFSLVVFSFFLLSRSLILCLTK